jgi:hypothetical protein
MTDERLCPNARQHTKCPKPYLAWHDWADRKARTHYQVRCPGCGLYLIWLPKKHAAVPE